MTPPGDGERPSWGSVPLRTWAADVPRSDVRVLLATFPLMFALHEAEEVLGMRSFQPDTRQRLTRILTRLDASERAAATVESASPGHMLAAVSTIGTAVATATLLAAGPPRDLRPWQAAFTVFSAHALTHAAQPLLLRGYTPGSLTATILIPAYYRYAARQLTRLGLWDPATKRRSLAAGAPAVALLLAIGHALASKTEATQPNERRL